MGITSTVRGEGSQGALWKVGGHYRPLWKVGVHYGSWETLCEVRGSATC